MAAPPPGHTAGGCPADAHLGSGAPGRPGLAPPARVGGTGYPRRWLRRVCAGAPSPSLGPPRRVRACGPAVAGRAALAPDGRAPSQPPRRGSPAAGRGSGVLLRAFPLHHHPAAAGLAVPAQACGVRAAAIGAGAGHHSGERRLLGLAGCPSPVLGTRDDRHPGDPRHPRRGPPARRHQLGEPVRRDAQPARRLGRLVRHRHRHHHRHPVASPGLALPCGDDPGGAGLGQPLPAGYGRRARRRRPRRLGCQPDHPAVRAPPGLRAVGRHQRRVLRGSWVPGGVHRTGAALAAGDGTCGLAMSSVTRAGTGMASASRAAAGRPGKERRWVRVLGSGRVRPASRRSRLWAWLLAAGVAAAVVHAHGAAGDLRAMPAHLDGSRLAWITLAVAAQIMSLAGSTAAQRLVLAAGGARVPWRALFGTVLASTGLARMMPAGPVTAGAWQVREYRRHGAGTGVGIWAVLAGGFTTMVVILAMLLAGAAIAGTSTLLLLTCAVAVLAAGAAGLTAAPRRALAVSRHLSRHPRRSPTIARLAAAVAGLPRQPTGAGWAAGVLACTAAGLAADAGVLTACFGLAGLPVPWRGLLFAYAAGQAAGRLGACFHYHARCPAHGRGRAPAVAAPTPAGNEDARPLLSSRRHRSARSCRQRFHPQAHLRVTPSRCPAHSVPSDRPPATPAEESPSCPKHDR